MSIQKTLGLFAVIIGAGLYCVQATGQTTRPPVHPASPAPRAPKPPTTGASGRSSAVVVENGALAPQVVTILHRLNGLKVFRLLLRSNEQLGAIEKLDQAFRIQGEVHTNVIAGLALDDGQTIAAWLPDAEAEIPAPPAPIGPVAPPAKSSRADGPERGALLPYKTPTAASTASFGFGGPPETADLKIITRDGKKLPGRYLGIDGLTGLSVIVLTDKGLPRIVDSIEENVSLGQRIRLIGPEPAAYSEPGTRGAMYVRIGETGALVSDVKRSPNGALARLRIKSAKLTPANIGGIAISDSGETLGIVDAVEGGEATIVPVGLVRSAAKRVIARQASVPRPWLGVRGEPVGALSLERIRSGGWQLERARALAEKRQGILLTSIAPGSPAALAQLRPGDVILSVNNGDVRDAQDFSWLLEEADLGSLVNFTVARPDKLMAEALAIKLSESPDPFFGLKRVERYAKLFKPGSLMAQGIETIAIMPRVATRFGATGGLLVVYVQPATAAYKAGLRPGDLIEAVDGRQIVTGSGSMTLLNNPAAGTMFTIVRNKEKLVLKVPAPDPAPDKQ